MTQPVLVALLLCLIVQCFYYIVFFNKAYAPHAKEVKKSNSPVSIIIASHQNIQGLTSTLSHLLQQSHPHFEVIAALDRTSHSSELEKQFAHHSIIQFIHIAEVPDHVSPKKNAISKAIELASYETLLFTDDDCTPSSVEWISTMVSSLEAQDAEILLGYSPHTFTASLLHQVITYETILTALQYLGLAANNKPYMAVGRNWMYKKSLFIRANGFNSHNHILSGDDDLLLQTMAPNTRVGITLDPTSMVYTIAKNEWRTWWIQKTRHSSTGWQYSFQIKLILSTYIITHIGFWGLLITSIFIQASPLLIIASFILRTTVLFVIFGRFTSRSKEKFEFKWLLLFDFVYPLYIGLLGVKSFLSKKVQWS